MEPEKNRPERPHPVINAWEQLDRQRCVVFDPNKVRRISWGILREALRIFLDRCDRVPNPNSLPKDLKEREFIVSLLMDRKGIEQDIQLILAEEPGRLPPKRAAS